MVQMDAMVEPTGPRESLVQNIDDFEKSLITNDLTMELKELPVARGSETDWDNTVVPGGLQPSEAFIIPVDAPDGKLKATRQANTYAAKKTVAQGMMDIALITANANQLRYIVEYTSNSKTYYFNLILISLSLILQVGVGMALIFKGRCDLRGESKSLHARRSNNFVVVGVFLVTIINVFIASFTITGDSNSQTVSLPDSGGSNAPRS